MCLSNICQIFNARITVLSIGVSYLRITRRETRVSLCDYVYDIIGKKVIVSRDNSQQEYWIPVQQCVRVISCRMLKIVNTHPQTSYRLSHDYCSMFSLFLSLSFPLSLSLEFILSF